MNYLIRVCKNAYLLKGEWIKWPAAEGDSFMLYSCISPLVTWIIWPPACAGRRAELLHQPVGQVCRNWTQSTMSNQPGSLFFSKQAVHMSFSSPGVFPWLFALWMECHTSHEVSALIEMSPEHSCLSPRGFSAVSWCLWDCAAVAEVDPQSFPCPPTFTT